MLQFLGARLLETENLAALRIDPGHDVPDGAVLAGGIHPLKDQQECITVRGIMEALQRAEGLHVFLHQFLELPLRLAKRLHRRRPLGHVYFIPSRYTEVLWIDFHVFHSPLRTANVH